jgi:hypothetical protein
MSYTKDNKKALHPGYGERLPLVIDAIAELLEGARRSLLFADYGDNQVNYAQDKQTECEKF